MTSCDEVRAWLDEYVDRELDAVQAGEVEAHLGSCLACRREAQRLRELVGQAAALPASLEPETDLWPEIARRIAGDAPTRGRFGVPRRAARWAALAAGLAAALVLAALVLRQPAREAVVPPTLSQPTPGLAVPARAGGGDVEAALAAYAQAADTLRAAIRRRDRTLPAATRRTIEENLDVIDAAISRLRVALAANPENRELEVLLVATYQQQIELLQRVTEIPAQG
jgi:hypothetical protein